MPKKHNSDLSLEFVRPQRSRSVGPGLRGWLLRIDFSSFSTYLKGVTLAAAFILPAAITQHFILFREQLQLELGIQWSFFIVPAAVIFVIGILFGRIGVLAGRLRQSTRKFRAVAEVAEEMIFLRNLSGRFEYVSPSSLRLCGYIPDDFYDNPDLMASLIHPDDRERWQVYSGEMNDRPKPDRIDIRFVSKGGSVIWVSHCCTAVYNDKGEHVAMRATNVDITERKKIEERVERMAYYDPLSGLPNRRSLELTIEQHITDSQNNNNRPFALLFLDLDRFKYINDSYGHFLGDKLLKQIAARLLDNVQDGYVARFGGDEFVFIARHIIKPDGALDFAEHIIRSIEEKFVVDEYELYLSGSIGISFYPQDGKSADELIKNADMAMYQSKMEQQSKVYFFQPYLAHRAEAFISTESSMRKALDKNHFELFYQPKVSIADGTIVGVEALARWRHPDQGIIEPNSFIPVAEETGLILPLGEQLIEIMLNDLARWERQGHKLPVALNVSGRQFLNSKFCTSMEHQIIQSHCSPDLVEVEITEQVFLRDLDATVIKLNRMKDHGIGVAIDDFGTGYSSLRYIKILPIDTIKIDRSFIWGAAGDRKDLAVVEAIVSLCQGLDLHMVAEGVETEEHCDLVEHIGCKVAQGYFFYRPLPAAELDRLLESSLQTGQQQ